MGWSKDKVDEVIENFHRMRETSHIRLYERYGEVNDNNDWTYRRVFYADVAYDEYDQSGNMIMSHPGVELASEEWEGHPYWEFHADKIPGRWLGVGVVEELFEPQIAQNQNTNLQNKSSYWAALKVFQTRDGAVNRNMMTDVRNGEIINVDSEITPINMASSENLAFFNQQDTRWMRNRDELTFSYDVVQGERLPAGTPLGSAQMAMTQTLSYFEQIQENIAMDVKEMIYEVIIPQFKKENTKEHTIRLVGKDLDTYAEMVKGDMAFKEVVREIVTTGMFPTSEDKKMIDAAVTERVKKEKEIIATVPKGFYDNVKYDIDIDITGESVDTRVRNATKFAILQAITADPMALQDPVKKKIIYMIAEDGGINPSELFDVDDTTVQNMVTPEMQARVGGGVSAPDLSSSVAGASQLTV